MALPKDLSQSPHPIKAEWQRINAVSLPRSSHTISVIAGRAYIFGGEINPREPVDNNMHVITLLSDPVSSTDHRIVPARPRVIGGAVPEKRVGHAAAVIGERIFIFGGRGGKDMKPLEERGRVWVYDTLVDLWSALDPVPGTPFPEARSYHSSVAIDKPGPSTVHGAMYDQAPDGLGPGQIAEAAQTHMEKGSYGTFFVHAGCPTSGRANDLWGFNVQNGTWKEFPTAPGKPRGGTSIAVSHQIIYRYGGFNGDAEEGGCLDFLNLNLQTFDGDCSAEETGASAEAQWQTLAFQGETVPFPGNRSVAGLQAITLSMGRQYLVLFLGERDPSSKGHDGAGKFWGDVWVFQCPPQGMTALGLKEATMQPLGRDPSEGSWRMMQVANSMHIEGEDVKGEGIKDLVPSERGWFSSSTLGDLNPSSLLLWGGLNGRNEREGDAWILRVE
jgi:hypothetical protein